jgi:hypothetical protein
MLGTKNGNSVGVIFDNGDGTVIGAGPLHHINDWATKPTLIRAVLVREYGKYAVAIQRWEIVDDEFTHDGFTERREYDENKYKDASLAFANLCLDLATIHPHLWH